MRAIPSLNSLRAFEATARLLSVRKAAAEIFVTPAAVSKQIKALEENLQCALFIRKNRRIELTIEGREYYQHIYAALKEISNATKEISKHKEKLNLQIRSYATMSVYWLIPRMSAFYAQHPNISVEISTTSVWEDFDNNHADAAIRLGDGNWPNLKSYPLIPNILAPVCSPDLLPLLKDVSDIRQFTLLHALARPNDWKLWLEQMGIQDIDPHIGHHYENSVFAYQAAMQGQGLAMAQMEMIQPVIDRGELALPFEHYLDRGNFTYYFVVPKDRPEIYALEIFREWLLNSPLNIQW